MNKKLNEDGCLLGCCALMMKAARTSATLVNFYQTTRRNNPEDSHFRTHCRENLKSYEKLNVSKAYNTITKRMQTIPAEYEGVKCMIKLCLSVLPKTVMKNTKS
jgi:hypothetical protein